MMKTIEINGIEIIAKTVETITTLKLNNKEITKWQN